MIAIVDYGVGNLFSIRSSLHYLGIEAQVTGIKEELCAADGIILPGVGAFGDAAEKLRATELDRSLIQLATEGKPLMGICLGMQLLFDQSLEFGRHKGLGLIPGTVEPLEGRIPEDLKIPHIGWNALQITAPGSPLVKGIHEGDAVYFVHSFHAVTPFQNIVARADYGIPVTACVQSGNVCGCQFHPEKSGSVGLRILDNFCREVCKSC